MANDEGSVFMNAVDPHDLIGIAKLKVLFFLKFRLSSNETLPQCHSQKLEKCDPFQQR